MINMDILIKIRVYIMERLRLTSIVKGTKAELTADTEIRANSIMFSEIDSRKVKFADGVHTYADLPYVTGALDEGDGAVYRFKGSVEKYSDLPTENNRAGDTYDVREDGKNYTWTVDGNWDDIGGTVDLSGYATKDDLDTETGKIYEAMASESEIRQEAEGDLQNNIDTVAGNLQDEVDNRTNAISDLTDALRQTDNDLEAETTARQEADDTLTDAVSVIQNNISVLDGEITDESNRAKEAETGLTNSKADKSDTLSGYGITDAYTKSEVDTALSAKADTANSLSGYGITDAYTKTETDTLVNNGLANKIDKFAELPEANKNYANKIVQYVGETTEDYTNGYFYKAVENGDLPNSIEFTPKEGVSTVVSVSPEDFIAFITPWCEGRTFTPSDVTHGSMGIYSSTQYSMTIRTDDGKYAYGIFTITELNEAGFTFTPPFGAQQGATFVCSINQKAYIWQQTNVQPETDTSALQAQIQSLTQQINDLKLTIPKEAFTADEVRSMTKQSGKVTLCSDVDLGVVSLVDGTFANNKTTINLNGHTLSANPTGGRALLQLRGTSQYTFNGDGYVDDWSNDSSCVWSRTADNVLTINGGTWIAHGHTETIYCQLGTIYINGGVFKTDMEDKRYVLNCLDANFKAGTAKIIVKGGEFWDFDPSANPEGEGTSYVAEGYTVTSRQEDGHTIYKVVKA